MHTYICGYMCYKFGLCTKQTYKIILYLYIKIKDTCLSIYIYIIFKNYVSHLA